MCRPGKPRHVGLLSLQATLAVQERQRAGGDAHAFYRVTTQASQSWRCRRGGSLGTAGNAFTVLLALAAAATAAWALAESLHTTDGKATEFWGIVTDARGRVRFH